MADSYNFVHCAHKVWRITKEKGPSETFRWTLQDKNLAFYHFIKKKKGDMPGYGGKWVFGQKYYRNEFLQKRCSPIHGPERQQSHTYPNQSRDHPAQPQGVQGQKLLGPLGEHEGNPGGVQGVDKGGEKRHDHAAKEALPVRDMANRGPMSR